MKRVTNADSAKFDIAEVIFAVAFGKKSVRVESRDERRFFVTACASIPSSVSIELIFVFDNLPQMA